MKKIFLALFIIPFMVSCGGSKKEEMYIPEIDMEYNNSFESALFWGCQDFRIQKVPSHSGNYSCVLDSNYSFSTTFLTAVGNISGGKPLTKVRATAWVKVKNLNANVSFGIQVETIDKVTNQPKVIYLGEDYLKKDPAILGSWNQLVVEKPMPSNLQPTDIIKVFAFNATKEIVYIDDISIKFFTPGK